MKIRQTHRGETQGEGELAHLLQHNPLQNREPGQVQAVTPQAAYHRIRARRTGTKPGDLLALQRWVGNRGVASTLLSSGGIKTRLSPLDGSARESVLVYPLRGQTTVQREPGDGPQTSGNDADALRRDLDGAIASRDWPRAAELLNAFNLDDMRGILKGLQRWQIASIHSGALGNPRVGRDAQVASQTRAAYLDFNYENSLKLSAWSDAAKFLNGFNSNDINSRLEKLSTDKVQALHDAVISNPEVGDQSLLAKVSTQVLTRRNNAQAPLGQVLSSGDAIAYKGDPLRDPRYIEATTQGVGIPIWGGPLYLKQNRQPGWSDAVVVPRSDFDFAGTEGAQSVEIMSVYKSREAALKAVAQSSIAGAYAFYLGPGNLILPTKFSVSSTPGVTASAIKAIQGEGDDAKAAESLGINLLVWYIGARFPAKVGEPAAPAQVVKSSLVEVLGEGEYAALNAAAEAAKAAHPELAALTTDEIIAIRAYSGESWSYLNQALRLKDANELRRLDTFINLTKSGLGKLPVYKGTVTRTIALDVGTAAQKYQAGAVVVEDAFTSTTFGKAVAQRGGKHRSHDRIRQRPEYHLGRSACRGRGVVCTGR